MVGGVGVGKKGARTVWVTFVTARNNGGHNQITAQPVARNACVAEVRTASVLYCPPFSVAPT